MLTVIFRLWSQDLSRIVVSSPHHSHHIKTLHMDVAIITRGKVTQQMVIGMITMADGMYCIRVIQILHQVAIALVVRIVTQVYGRNVVY